MLHEIYSCTAKLSWISKLVLLILFLKKLRFRRSTVRLKISYRNIIWIWLWLSNWKFCAYSPEKKGQDAGTTNNGHHMSWTSTVTHNFYNWHFQLLYHVRTNANHLYQTCTSLKLPWSTALPWSTKTTVLLYILLYLSRNL